MTAGVSVVVPVYNGERTLQACLDGLLAQDYAGPVDLIVVDNGSTDGTRRIAGRLGRGRLATCNRLGPAAARNDGVELARYELIAFTDADCVPEPGWLAALVGALRPDLAGVGGPLINASRGPIADVVADISFDQAAAAAAPLPYLATSNALFRRVALRQAGGFDERFAIAGGEDNDFGWRLHALGLRIAFVAQARVRHCHASTLMDFVSQRVRYGYGEALLMQKHVHLREIRDLRRQESPYTTWRALCGSVRRGLGGLLRRDVRPAVVAMANIAFACGRALGRLGTGPRWTTAEAPAAGGPMCVKPWTSFEMDDQNGNILPCCWTRTTLGNVNQNSIAEIWNGPGYVEFRRRMLADDYADLCPSDCPHRTGAMHHELPPVSGSGRFHANLVQLHEDLGARRLRLAALPVVFRLLPSIRCNLDCIMCWQRVEADAALPERFYDELDELLPLLSSMTLQGGEPLMLKRCRELLARAATPGLPDLAVSMITNGTFLDDKFLRLIEGARVEWLLVSLDAATAETYRTIRGADFQAVCGGIRRVLEQRPDIPLTIACVVMRENVHELTDFIRLAEALGVDCEFSPLNAAYRKGDDFADAAFRADLAAAVRDADAFIAERGLVRVSLDAVKQRMWNEQFTSYRSRSGSRPLRVINARTVEALPVSGLARS